MGYELEQFWVMDTQGRALFSVDAHALPDPAWWPMVSEGVSTHGSYRVALDGEGLELLAWHMTAVGSGGPDAQKTIALYVRSIISVEGVGLATGDASIGSQMTPRQAEVSEYAASGATVHEIATHLGISIETVRSHLKAVYRNFGIANRVELARALSPGHVSSAPQRPFNAFM